MGINKIGHRRILTKKKRTGWCAFRDAVSGSRGFVLLVCGCITLIQSLPVHFSVSHGVDPAQAEPDAVITWINLDHAQSNHIAFFEYFLGMFDTFLTQFGNMDQTFNIAFQLGKGTKFRKAGDLSLNQLADSKSGRLV